jgi:hypothetical protein
MDDRSCWDVGDGESIMLPAAHPTMKTPMSTHIMPTAMLNTSPPSSHKIAAAIEASMSVRDLESIMFTFQI